MVIWVEKHYSVAAAGSQVAEVGNSIIHFCPRGPGFVCYINKCEIEELACLTNQLEEYKLKAIAFVESENE